MSKGALAGDREEWLARRAGAELLVLGKSSWTYLVLGKGSWTSLVLLSYGRSSTGPHLVGVKSISRYMCISTQACTGLALCRVSCGKELSQYCHAFPHGTDGVRSTAGELGDESVSLQESLGGLCLQWVWFGWEKYPAGRWEPEHIGRLVPNEHLQHGELGLKPVDGQCRGICSWGKGLWSLLWSSAGLSCWPQQG